MKYTVILKLKGQLFKKKYRIISDGISTEVRYFLTEDNRHIEFPLTQIKSLEFSQERQAVIKIQNQNQKE